MATTVKIHSFTADVTRVLWKRDEWASPVLVTIDVGEGTGTDADRVYTTLKRLLLADEPAPAPTDRSE